MHFVLDVPRDKALANDTDLTPALLIFRIVCAADVLDVDDVRSRELEVQACRWYGTIGTMWNHLSVAQTSGHRCRDSATVPAG